MSAKEDKNADRIIVEGEVIKISNDRFLVKISEGYEILATLAGRIRQSGIRILVGDLVRVEAGQYEPTKGRIIYRMKA